MSYVYQLPIDTAKVDKTCVSALCTQQEKYSVHQLGVEREVNKTSE
jgi:sensor c-di-GMP phosphodiesterase-like protein